VQTELPSPVLRRGGWPVGAAGLLTPQGLLRKTCALSTSVTQDTIMVHT